ncbi:MAG: iron chelate uptake ABC transporter family permease subunit, partial [Chloroflexi bacterium]|nr:iron chelate uptake ABC transporter family permease subunit [Chloroflexota bacterium]
LQRNAHLVSRDLGEGGLLSLTVGPVNIPLSHVAGVILAPFGVEVAEYTRTERLVIEQLRLPRIIEGALVGGALGVAGATMQGLFRNPMADPGIIGVSAGGAVGAVAAIAFGLDGLFLLSLPLFAFLGAMTAMTLVYFIALAGGRFSVATLLLAGVAVASFLGAVVSAIIVLVPNDDSLREIIFWLAGGLDGRTWEHVRASAPLILGGVGVLMLFARDINLLMLGDDEARSLGVRVGLTRTILITGAALITGVAVAFSGTIAFVGLVIPHMLRLVFGPDHRVLLPVSALGGAVFLVVADTIARTVIQPAELRVGIITALVGAPFFVFLIIRNKRQVEAM